MRNANESEVLEARRTGILKQDLMYLTGSIPYKVHGKDVEISLARLVADDAERYGMEGIAIAETDSGRVIMVQTKLLKPVATGPSQQPKKPRHRPVPGSKRETLVPMSTDVKLKVGDKVVLSDGTREVVCEVDRYTEVGVPYRLTGGKRWYRYSGDGFCHLVHITHKIIPWTPPAPAYKPEDVAFNKTVVKCTEEIAFDKGYWVPFIATDYTGCPAWAAKEKVMVIVSGEYLPANYREFGAGWDWTYDTLGTCIIAYRKAQQ